MEVLVFAGILLIGLAYVWVKGDLDWIRPEPIKPDVKTGIPDSVYQDFNNSAYQNGKENNGTPALVGEANNQVGN